MNTKRAGKCINFGNCTKADNKEIIELEITEDFLCPECNSELQAEFQNPKERNYSETIYSNSKKGEKKERKKLKKDLDIHIVKIEEKDNNLIAKIDKGRESKVEGGRIYSGKKYFS